MHSLFGQQQQQIIRRRVRVRAGAMAATYAALALKGFRSYTEKQAALDAANEAEARLRHVFATAPRVPADKPTTDSVSSRTYTWQAPYLHLSHIHPHRYHSILSLLLLPAAAAAAQLPQLDLMKPWRLTSMQASCACLPA